MSEQDKLHSNANFDFEGNITQTDVYGFEYKNVFSPCEPLDEMPLRMEQRIKQVRKMRKKNIFSQPYTAPKTK